MKDVFIVLRIWAVLVIVGFGILVAANGAGPLHPGDQLTSEYQQL
ncbi:MAG: hypothetical protein WC465_05030 [Patescibacteria group bacterium]